MTSRSVVRALAALSLAAILLPCLGGCDEDCDHSITAPDPVDTVETIIDDNVQISDQAGLDAIVGVRHITGSLQIYQGVADISGLGSLQTVGRLSVYGTNLTDLSGLDSLRSCGQSLDIQNNGSLISLAGLERLQSVERIFISSNGPLESLTPLSGVIGLKQFSIRDQPGLESLAGITATSGLEYVEVSGCADLVDLGITTPMPALRNLNLRSLPSLTGVSLSDHNLGANWACDLFDLPELVDVDMDCSGLYELELIGLDRIRDLNWLVGASVLRNLKLSGLDSLESLTGPDDFSQVQYLHLDELPSLSSLAEMPALPQGCDVALTDCPNLVDLGFPTGGLDRFIIDGCGIADLSSLESQPSCRDLTLAFCGDLTSLAGIGRLSNLVELEIMGCTALASLGADEDLLSLTILNLADCHGLMDLSGMGQCPLLDQISIQACSGLHDLSGLEFPDTPRSLTVQSCQQLVSLSGLETITSLEYLRFTINSLLASLQGLENLEWVERLYIVGNPSLPQQEIDDLLDRIIVTDTVTYGGNGS